MNMERGFIPIPIIIAIVVGILAVGGATYIGVSVTTYTKDTDEEPVEQTEDFPPVTASTPTSTDEAVIGDEE